MMEWRDENDEMEADGRMVKNGEINNNERLFEEKITNYLNHIINGSWLTKLS